MNWIPFSKSRFSNMDNPTQTSCARQPIRTGQV